MSSTHLSRRIISLVSPKNWEPGSPHLDDPHRYIYFSCSGPQSIRLCVADPASADGCVSKSCFTPLPGPTKLRGDVSLCPPKRSQSLLTNSALALTKRRGHPKEGSRKKDSPLGLRNIAESQGPRESDCPNPLVCRHVHLYQTQGLVCRWPSPAPGRMIFSKGTNTALPGRHQCVWFTGSLKIKRGHRCDKRQVVDRCRCHGWFRTAECPVVWNRAPHPYLLLFVATYFISLVPKAPQDARVCIFVRIHKNAPTQNKWVCVLQR